MIDDPHKLAFIQEQWEAVSKLLRGGRTCFAEGVCVNESHDDRFYNLPFVLAFSVLNQVLDELADQGRFKPVKNLSVLMERSLECVPPVIWLNYELVNEGRDKRNAIAHRGTLFPRSDCLKYVAAVEEELKAWGIAT